MTMKKEIIDRYLSLLKIHGENGLYALLIYSGAVYNIKKIHGNISENLSEVDLLNLSDNFFILFRKNGDNNYFLLGKVFRRAAHVLYRYLLKKDKSKNINPKFLNLIKS
jgi:hypothetical protein